ncbi:MAG: class I SAM-dependent methyltransferase [Coleofasciculus sp. A1-SPW-01]|uniref:class I SAM-dependent methyltransferase n=1 Tax=Coleofasciculus sp. A1-SPW-01 TaxID=3070819 RepID=UPI0032F3C746
MIESNNPEINVDELIEKIKVEVARTQERPVEDSFQVPAISPIIDRTISQIEALIASAEFKSQIRTELPDRLNRFPFNISRRLQKLVLKLYTFIFKEQRAVNFALIQALRESLVLNQQLRDALQSQITAMNERYIRQQSQINYDLAQQKRLISLFLEKACQHQPELLSQEQFSNWEKEYQHLSDKFYVAFEDRFRGSREDILNRLKFYLPIIKEAKVGQSDTSPILDVGCGRGEWLELLRESNYLAKGLDINRMMVEECQARKLEVIESDALSHLRTLPDSSLGAVTGFHIVEHLTFPKLIELLTEVIRVLKPGGLAIFETPNPQNFIVGSCDFYSDPTHRSPIFPETLRFILEYQGFYRVQLLYLNPVETSPFDSKEEPEWQILRNWFYGSRDYAVIGYKR